MMLQCVAVRVAVRVAVCVAVCVAVRVAVRVASKQGVEDTWNVFSKTLRMSF